MKMHPKFMMLGKIDVNKMEVEFEKGVTKARYALMNINDKSGNHENENAEDDITKNEVYDIEKRTADYANVRATDRPTVQRLFPPKPARMNQEIAMQSLKEKLLRRTIQFKEEKCNQNGWLNEKNVSKNVVNGLKETREKVKAGEMVVFQSDKSSQLTADTVDNNMQALEAHTAGDIVVDGKRVKDIEENCNQHLKQFNKMFSVGAAHGQKKRIAHASTATNVPPPPKYPLRKDHKVLLPGQEITGPDVRAVCGASEAPNSRLGHFLSMIVNAFSDDANHDNECASGEEMKAAFKQFNMLDKEIRTKCKIVSMDVKALYPSMRW